jgi:hypothetical protein
MLVIGSKIGPTRTTKNLKKGVVRNLAKQTLKGGLHVNDTSRHAINEKTGSNECITPVSKRNRRVCKQCEACLNYMAMFTLSTTILLMGVGTGNTMGDANFLKEGIKFNVLATPVRLNMHNFVFKKTFNMRLKL